MVGLWQDDGKTMEHVCCRALCSKAGPYCLLCSFPLVSILLALAITRKLVHKLQAHTLDHKERAWLLLQTR